MAFTRWDSYVDLLDGMYRSRSEWDSARTIEDLTRYIRERCRALVGSGDPELGQYSDVREWGYASLLAELEPEFLDPNVRFEQVRLAALARPARDHEMGPDWDGYYLSERTDGTKVYSDWRFAEPSHWHPVGESSGTDPQEQAADLADEAATVSLPEEISSDPRQEHFDETTGRWRRLAEDNEYEYYHDTSGLWERVRAGQWCHFDAVTGRWRRWVAEDNEYEYHDDTDDQWERARAGSWCRYHGNRFGWLAYDRPSMTWLDPTTPQPQWRSHQEIGTPVGSPVDDEKVVATREHLQAEGLKAAEQAGLVPGRVSADDWRAYFDKHVLTALRKGAA
jgi:hypothetical protein